MNMFKTLLLKVTFLLIFPHILLAQWTTSLGNGVDIDVVSPTTAYMVGDLPITQLDGIGYIYKTTDGGATVTKLREKTMAYYRGVFFFNETKGFVVGSENTDGTSRDTREGVILKTENGGVSWTRQVLPELYLHGIYFINEQIGFAYSGFSGVSVYKTTDGGANWREVKTTESFRATNMQFINAQTGFLATTNGVLKTTDAGETWQIIETPERANVTNVWFNNDAVGYISVGNSFFTADTADIYRTGDSGLTWEKIYTSPTSSIMNGLKFVNPLVGFALERTDDDKLRILKTADGGNTWKIDFTQNRDPNDFLKTLEKWDFSGNTAIVIGRTNLIRNANFTTNLNLNQPTALISGTTNICPNNPVRLRFDFTGNAPYSLILKTQDGANTPLSNISSNPYFYTVTPTKSTTYTVSNFTANGVNGRVGGSATIANDVPTSAYLIGEESICLGEMSQNLKVILRGCPPFTVKIADWYGRDSFTFNGLIGDTVSLKFKPRLGTDGAVTFKILSATDAENKPIINARTDAKLSVFEPILRLISSGETETVCENVPFKIDLEGNWESTAKFTYFNGVDIDTVRYDENGKSFIKLKKSIAPMITLNSYCGKRSVQFRDVKTVLPAPSAPTQILVKNIADRGVELNWKNAIVSDALIGIMRYNFRGFENIAILPSNTTRYFDSLAPQGDTYKYYITAQFDNGCDANHGISDTVSIDNMFFYRAIPQPEENKEYAVIWSYLNKDSLPDVVSNSGVNINLGNKNFAAAQPIIPYGVSRIEIADFDNDGDMDFLSDYQNNDSALILNINVGNGVFERKTVASGLHGYPFFTWVDYNDDGWVDFVNNHKNANGDNMTIHINNKNGTFTPLPIVSGQVSISPFKEEGKIYFSDFDKDGDRDACIFSNDKVIFYKNSENNVFTTVTMAVPSTNFILHDAYFYDYDSDGDEDFVLYFNPGHSDVRDPNYPIKVLRNNNGQFTIDSKTYAVENAPNPMESVNLADFNNDGLIDFINVPDIYINQGNGTYTPYRNNIFSGGIGGPFSFADADRDGDIDIALSAEGTGVHYNDIKNKGNWLELRLEGKQSNKAAIGSYALIKAKRNGVGYWQMRSVAPSKGFLFAKDDITLHFGLGDATIIDSVIIQWTSGKKTILTNLPVNQYRHIVEDATVNTNCARVEAKILPLNNITKLCNQNGTVRLTASKFVGETVKWFRITSGVSLLVSTKDTLILAAENETGIYTVEIRDTLRGCPSLVSTNTQQVTIANPNISATVLDSIICGNKAASVLLKTQNNTSFYNYTLEKYNTTTLSFELKGVINLRADPYPLNEGGTYRFTASANSDNTCKAFSSQIIIKDGNTDLFLSGKVTLGATSTPSVNSRVWLYQDNILQDSTLTDANGNYTFKVNRLYTYQIKAASNDARYAPTFHGGTVKIMEAISLRLSNCENVKANIALLLKTASQERVKDKISFKSFPNPFSETLEIEAFILQSGTLKITVFDRLGRAILPVRSYFVSKENNKIVVKGVEILPTGLYVLRITLDEMDTFLKISKF